MSYAASVNPVASLERLKQAGLDPAMFGSCSKRVTERVPNGGTVVINQGCFFYEEQTGEGKLRICPMRSVPMPDGPMVSGEDSKPHRPPNAPQRPRPRFVKVRHIKPVRGGTGDTIRESYCTCAQWCGHLRGRDGKNGEIAEVCGGEGDSVLLPGTKRERNADGAMVEKPCMTKAIIPEFPDVEDNPVTMPQVYAAAVRESAADESEKRHAEERDRRMATSSVGKSQPKAETTEATTQDVRDSIPRAEKASPKGR